MWAAYASRRNAAVSVLFVLALAVATWWLQLVFGLDT
jgi:hypothetical protein